MDQLILILFFVVFAAFASAGAKAQAERRKQAFDFEPENLLGDAGFATDKECKAAGLLNGKGIPCGHSPEKGKLLRFDGDSMAITVAPVGSGKTTVQTILACLSMDDRSIVSFCTKGETPAVTAKHRASCGPCYIVAPYGGVVSGTGGVRQAHLNPMDILWDPNEPAADFYANSRSIAQGCIFLETQNAEGEFFSAAALNATHFVTMGVARHEPKEKRTLQRVAEILATDEIYEWSRWITSVAKEQLLKQKGAMWAAGRKDDRTVEGILQTVRTNLEFLNDPPIAEWMSRSDFSIQSLRQRLSTVYFTVPPGKSAASSRAISLFINVTMNRLLAPGKGKKRVVVMLDDFTTYGALPCIESAIAISRGFGVAIWPLIQDLSQLESRYPKGWQSFLSNAGLRVFMTPQDEKTARYVSDQLGVMQVSGWQKSVSFDRTGNISEGWSRPPSSRPLQHPHEVRALPDTHMYVFVRGMVNAIRARRIPYFGLGQYRRKAQPNPYYRPEGIFAKIFGR
jgi:type IV secretion system protein VirD4